MAGETRADLDPTGKQVVSFFQTDFYPTRMRGQLRLQPEVRRLLQTLDWHDRVAVVSFDSHLKLRQDFTRDEALLEDAFRRAIRTGQEPRIAPARHPSLARAFDSAAARALAPLPGEKVLLYVGWGLGRLSGGTVSMTPDYAEALRESSDTRVVLRGLGDRRDSPGPGIY